jgi:hypothetical protein
LFVRSNTLPLTADWIQIESGVELRIVSSVRELNHEDWAKVNGEGNLFTSYSFLSAFEETAPAEIQCVYALVRSNGELKGAYVFQIVHLTPEALAFILQPLSGAGKIVGGLADWLTRCKEQKGMRVLISGNNFISGEHGVITTEHHSKARMFRLMPKVVQKIIDRYVEPTKISLVLVKDYYAGKAVRPEKVLSKLRYHTFSVEPEMVLDIHPDWKNYNDYEQAMSKKYRNRSRSVLKKSCVLEPKELNADEIFVHRNEIFGLYMAVHSNARFRLAALTPEYFVKMKSRFPDEFKLTIYILEGKIVAFRSGFENLSEYEAHFIGLDYTLNRDKCLYQRILYDFVDDAIQFKAKRLLLGRTAAEIKSTVGAVPHDLICFMRHRNSFSNHIISPFVDYLKPEDWVQRNPFSKSEPE